MLSEDRRALHRIPEVDWALPKTAAYLRARLEALPCEVFSPCGDALCAYFDFGTAETVAVRSDMDALPVTEATGLPFASQHSGRMHACGHDGHMAMVLGLADWLAEHRAAQNVLLIFEPAEETSGGAKAICDTGIFEKYHVTRVYGMHLWPKLPQGTVGARAGGMMARSAQLGVEIAGRSVHIAQWREGADALFAAAEFLRRAYVLAQSAPCLLRFGKLVSGTVNNAVSDRSALEGSLRCFGDAEFDRLWNGLEDIARAVEAETGCRVTLSCTDGYYAVTNDAALLAAARERFPIVEVEPTLITEDFSEYQRRVPGVFFLLGTGGEALHSPKFDFDECVLDTGLALLTTLVGNEGSVNRCGVRSADDLK